MIKNSWGFDFADEGFFRVAKDALGLGFINVHFEMSDLSEREIKTYCRAPRILEIRITTREQLRGTVRALGWSIDYQSLRVERVRRRSSPIAAWNKRNPCSRVHPGYQIFAVNSEQGRSTIIHELCTSADLHITLIMSDPCKLDDVLDDGARGNSYAHAVATSVRNAQGRIFGRTVDLHDEIVASLLRTYGSDAPNMGEVLEDCCARRGLHWAGVDEARVSEVLQERSLIASFALSRPSWKAFSRFFMDAPNRTLQAGDLGISTAAADESTPEQPATVIVVGQGADFWMMKDPLSWDVRRPEVLRIAKDAVKITFHDVFFYRQDLSPGEVELYEHAPNRLNIQIGRDKSWVKGTDVLGWKVDPVSLQVEWIASWGPVAAWNRGLRPIHRVQPGHRVVGVNGHVDIETILAWLTRGDHLNIELAKCIHSMDGKEANIFQRVPQARPASRAVPGRRRPML